MLIPERKRREKVAKGKASVKKCLLKEGLLTAEPNDS